MRPATSNATRLNGTGYLVPRLGVNHFVGSVLNGWGLSAIATWQSGFPYTVFSQMDNSFSAIGADRADLTVPRIKNAILSTGRSHAQLANEWFATSAFATNAIGTFRNSGKNILRGPRYFDTDLAVLKNTDLEKGGLLAVQSRVLQCSEQRQPRYARLGCDR